MVKWKKEKKLTKQNKLLQSTYTNRVRRHLCLLTFHVEDGAWRLRWAVRQGKEIKGGIIGKERNQRILIWRWNDPIHKRPYIGPPENSYIWQIYSAEWLEIKLTH